MRQIDNLSSDTDQLVKIVLDDGSFVQFNFHYYPGTQRWNVDILWNSFEMDGIGLCAHPNLLREFRNTLPFGLTIVTTDGLDPAFVDDFTNGRVTAYVLNADEVAQTESNIFAVAP